MKAAHNGSNFRLSQVLLLWLDSRTEMLVSHAGKLLQVLEERLPASPRGPEARVCRESGRVGSSVFPLLAAEGFL